MQKSCKPQPGNAPLALTGHDSLTRKAGRGLLTRRRTTLPRCRPCPRYLATHVASACLVSICFRQLCCGRMDAVLGDDSIRCPWLACVVSQMLDYRRCNTFLDVWIQNRCGCFALDRSFKCTLQPYLHGWMFPAVERCTDGPVLSRDGCAECLSSLFKSSLITSASTCQQVQYGCMSCIRVF